MKPTKFGVGQAITRVEDFRLLRGAGRYTSDVMPQGSLHAVFLRSPHAHAKFTFSGLDAGRKMPGIRAIFTIDDFAGWGDMPCVAMLPGSDGKTRPAKPHPVLARETVFHVGDAVAMVVAETAAAARDAAEAIEVDYAPLPPVVGSEAAVRPGAPQLHAGAPGNIVYDGHIGDKTKTDAIFAKAAHVSSIRIVNPRVVANYMEPRGAVAEHDSKTGVTSLHVSSQGVHGVRDLICGPVMKIDPKTLVVRTEDVGGGFGTKSFLYREYPLVVEAARRLKAPVRWHSDRSEHFLADAHGRDNITTAEMAMDKDGRFLAIRVDILSDLGAYLSTVAPYIPWLGATMATGVYDIAEAHARVRAVYTTSVPVDAYRGAGRPEAAYVLERLVDVCAHDMKLAPHEIRARNQIKSSQMPYKTKTGRTYDVGDFEGARRACMVKADYAGFIARAEAAKAKGRVRGIGISSYIECTAWNDSEAGTVTLGSNGVFEVLIGTQSNGQGHETAYAQVVSQHLDVPLDRIKVIQGDTSRIPTGFGTGGSRSIPIGAVMVDRASQSLAQKLKHLAADKLEAAIGDLEITDGHVRIVGTDRKISYAEIAALPAAKPDDLKGAGDYKPPDATYPNGTHICEVEIDPETGATDIVRYNVVDDYGFTLNPMLLQGQVHGGVVQGIGQALMEGAVYDQDGQLLTASLMDYCVPRADTVPSFGFETRNIPSTSNPLGLKGAGEAGSIGSTPAVMNAVSDALRRGFGVTHIDMPATPAVVRRAIVQAQRA